MSDVKTELIQVVPVLPAQHIGETIRFYTEKLGFTVGYQDTTYAIVSRQSIMLHFWHCPDRHIAENSSCYLYVRHIEPLYAEYMQANVVHPNGALERKPYGVKEFTLLDNNGNAIRVAERVEA